MKSSSLMQNIDRGHLRVLTYTHIYNFPALSGSSEDDPYPEPRAELRVANDVFWIRLFTMSDLGFAEAYMYGDVECDDLVAVFEVCGLILGKFFFFWKTCSLSRCSCTTERISPISPQVYPSCSRCHRLSQAPGFWTRFQTPAPTFLHTMIYPTICFRVYNSPAYIHLYLTLINRLL